MKILDDGSLVIPPGTKLEDAKKQLYQWALQAAGQNRSRAAWALGVSTRSMRAKANEVQEENHEPK